MKTFTIKLTLNKEGFWLAQLDTLWGDIEDTPEKALLSLVEKAREIKKFTDSGAIVMTDIT